MANTALPNLDARGKVPIQPNAFEARKLLHERVAKRGAQWFYWIAGLSVINSLIILSGSTTHFVVGLGITEFFDAVGKQSAGNGQSITLVLSVAIVGIFVLIGYFACKIQQWSFVVGMLLYGLDALLLLSFHDLPSVGFHGLVLYFLFKGYSAARSHSTLKPANAPLG